MSDETKQSDDNAASEPSPSAQEAEPQWKDLDKGPIWVLEPSQPFRIAMGDKPPSSLPPRTVDQLFRSAVKRGPESMALAVKRDGGWKRWTWQQYYNDTKRVAKAFIKVASRFSRCRYVLLRRFLARFGAVSRRRHIGIQFARMVHVARRRDPRRGAWHGNLHDEFSGRVSSHFGGLQGEYRRRGKR